VHVVLCVAGALYHRACSGSPDCALAIHTSSFDDNQAKGGGGAVFTTNGSLLSLPEDCQGSADDTAGRDASAAPCRDSSSFRYSRNTAAFGSEVASKPSRLGVASGSELAWLRELDSDELSTARRRLLARAEPNAAEPGAPKVLYLESNNRFNLEVWQLDHWGSNVVTDGPRPADATMRLMDHGTPSSGAAANAAGSAQNSSLCARSCEPSKPCVLGCLSGATTVAFRNGVANFSSVGLSAPANSSLKMQVLPGGLSGVPLVDVLVRVHTCGVGEYQSSSGSCEQCPAPQINLDPYKSSTCSSCPFGANCQAGFLIPLPGFWHSHHRSTLFHRCPSQAACTPADEGKRMLVYQQLHKHDGIPGWLEKETAVGEEYLQAQCATGRAGPLCSSCARGFGMGPGNVCRKCPSTGRVGAWVAYFVVRLLDVLLVTLLTCMMLLVWSCTRGCFSGGLGQQWGPSAAARSTHVVAILTAYFSRHCRTDSAAKRAAEQKRCSMHSQTNVLGLQLAVVISCADVKACLALVLSRLPYGFFGLDSGGCPVVPTSATVLQVLV
jgi:predicted outer membrane repeat protein